MLFFGKRLEEVTEADLQALVGHAREFKLLDFKRELPDKKRESRKEFLADISSFANASGGDIIFGMEENGGVASPPIGLDITDAEQEINRLSQMALHSIKPKIHGLDFHPVKLSNSKYVIIAHIPNSWAGPHVVDFDGHWRFYTRTSSHRDPLGVAELRTAFIASETLRERIRNFHMERLGNIVSGETPIELEEVPLVVIHAVPFNSFEQPAQLDISQVMTDGNLTQNPRGIGRRYNFDGLLMFRQPAPNPARQYWQIFRNGVVEYVDADIMLERDKIPADLLELTVVEYLRDLLIFYGSYDVELPMVLSINLLDFRGVGLDSRNMSYADLAYGHTLEQDNLGLPELLIESSDIDPANILKPVFDTIWNACGQPRSHNYDKQGNWTLYDSLR